MANAIDLNKKCFFLITGASRGIGHKMALECSRKFKANSTIVLLARSAAGLETTKTEILAINPKLNVITRSIDLTKPSPEDLNKIIQESLVGVDKTSLELAFVIHNVGTIGNVTQLAKQLEDPTELTNYFSTNVFSVSTLNAQFIKHFENTKMLIVNVTSKAGVVPIKSFVMYCSGKAAREMYFRVLAEEEPQILVLNYSPGPVDTDMTVDVQARSCDEGVRGMFSNLREEKTILTCAQTTEKFIAVLAEGKYKSGDHVDYYDDLK
jgi:sepiapterin reductase